MITKLCTSPADTRQFNRITQDLKGFPDLVIILGKVSQNFSLRLCRLQLIFASSMRIRESLWAYFHNFEGTKTESRSRAGE